MVTQAFTYTLDPTVGQVQEFWSHLGGSRFAYNHLLSLVEENWSLNRERRETGEDVGRDDYLGTSHFDFVKLWNSSKGEVAPWWAVNGAGAYNDAAQRLASAFKRFRTGQSKFPKRKKRRDSRSMRFTNQQVSVLDRHHVRLARMGDVKTFESMRKLARHLERGTGKLVAATLKHQGGKWFLVFTAEIERHVPTRLPLNTIGVDVGIKTLYTGATPDGVHVLDVANPRHLLAAQEQLTHVQRIASRRQGPKPGVAPSNRWRRANTRVQKVHTKVTNQRKDLIHNTTTRLAKDFDVIVVEDLNVSGMLHNHKLAKHIADAAFGEFVRQLEYKTTWYGSTLVKADRFYPSSKTCSNCGTVKTKLPLTERLYVCESCGMSLDRDVNAAINLARLGPTGTPSVAERGGNQKTSTAQAVLAGPVESLTEPRTVGM